MISDAAEPQPSSVTPRERAPQWPPQTSAPAFASPQYAEPRPASRDVYAPVAEEFDSPLAVLAARAEARRAEIQPQPRSAPRYEADQQFAAYTDDRIPAPEQQAHGHEEVADEAYYQDEAPLDPNDDQVYDDAPRARRRGGLATALALVGCALLGTAGAYAYRSYSVPSGTKESPPVIVADQTPTKLAAAPQADPQAGKSISERFANAASPDNLVSRQEEPVALPEPVTPPAPRAWCCRRRCRPPARTRLRPVLSRPQRRRRERPRRCAR